jgi:phenylalanyl-tRNA synthetase beta subunit
LTQVETYPWVSEKQVQPFLSSLPDNRFLKLQNPVNPECPLLRDSLVYQFGGVATNNAKFFDTFGIFDTGKVRTTQPVQNDENTAYAKAHLDEQFRTGILLYRKSLNSREEDTLLEAKGIVEMLLAALGLTGEQGAILLYEPTTFPYFHPKKQGNICYQ